MQIFETFKQKWDEKEIVQRNKEMEERLKAQYLKQQQRVSELVWIQTPIEVFALIGQTSCPKTPLFPLPYPKCE
jgi:hypothetical protein